LFDCNCLAADKSVDEIDDGEVSSVTARGIVDMLERDNKSLVQRSRELEKQLHILRAAGSRMPPSKSMLTFYYVHWASLIQRWCII